MEGLWVYHIFRVFLYAIYKKYSIMLVLAPTGINKYQADKVRSSDFE